MPTKNKNKKNKVVKKVSKKKPVKAKKASSQELVIRVEQPKSTTLNEFIQPMMAGKKMTLAKSWINQDQLIKIVQKTPAQHIYERPGKGGQKFTYVTGNYVIKALNFVFAWNWDFEVLSHGIEQGQVWVHGKLTVKGPNGETITKSQFGRADIKYLKDPKTKRPTSTMLDFGNDLKGASTDSLKKCASMLGIASDVYGKQEVKETGLPVANEDLAVPEEDRVEGPGGEPTAVCKVCGDPITDQEYGFSKKLYGKPLCREHQAEVKRK